jgi:SSS family solute:Na+ symporter
MTSAKPESELRGLVFSLTERITDREQSWYRRPAVLATVVLALTAVLNILFW